MVRRTRGQTICVDDDDDDDQTNEAPEETTPMDIAKLEAAEPVSPVCTSPRALPPAPQVSAEGMMPRFPR